jgi:hypothetical protein
MSVAGVKRSFLSHAAMSANDPLLDLAHFPCDAHWNLFRDASCEHRGVTDSRNQLYCGKSCFTNEHRLFSKAAESSVALPQYVRSDAMDLPTPFQREVASRFGLVPNFFVAEPDAPEIVERLWPLRCRPTSTIPFRLCSRSGSLSISRDFARCVTVSSVTVRFYSATDTRRAIPLSKFSPWSKCCDCYQGQRPGSAG